MELSVISPVHKTAHYLEELTQRLIETCKKLASNFEIIYVDDGSPDNAWEVIEKIAHKHSQVRGIRFSRNFGQHYALTAGLDVASGESVVIMDSDLQDIPEEIPKLYAKALEGFPVVLARRGKRKDPWHKRMVNWGFYKVFNWLTGFNYDNQVGGFRIISKQVAAQIRQMREQSRFINGLIYWMGYETAFVDVAHGKRSDGKSSYTLGKLLKFGLDIITSYSEKPLKLSIILGTSMAVIAFVLGLFFVIRGLVTNSPVLGWTSLITSFFFLGGIIIFNLGIIGMYLGKTFIESKKRPLYIIEKDTKP